MVWVVESSRARTTAAMARLKDGAWCVCTRPGRASAHARKSLPLPPPPPSLPLPPQPRNPATSRAHRATLSAAGQGESTGEWLKTVSAANPKGASDQEWQQDLWHCTQSGGELLFIPEGPCAATSTCRSPCVVPVFRFGSARGVGTRASGRLLQWRGPSSAHSFAVHHDSHTTQLRGLCSSITSVILLLQCRAGGVVMATCEGASGEPNAWAALISAVSSPTRAGQKHAVLNKDEVLAVSVQVNMQVHKRLARATRACRLER